MERRTNRHMIIFILETKLKLRMFALKISQGQFSGHNEPKLNFCVHHRILLDTEKLWAL